MRRSPVGVLVAAVAMLGLAACGSPATGPATTNTNSAFPVTFTDAMGQVTIPTQPSKVAALDTSYADDVLALETQLVAFTRYPGFGDALPPYLGEDAKKYGSGAKAIGDLATPSIEQLAVAKPDLIISAKVRSEQIHGKLTPLAPTVFSETTGATWKDNIRLLARALGKSALAEQKIKAYEDRAHKIGEAVKAKLGRTPTASLARFVAGESTVRLYSSASFVGIVLKDVGLARPAGQPDSTSKIAVNLSLEQTRSLDADYVFDTTWADPKAESKKVKAEFTGNPLWSQLKGKITDVDDVTWISSCSLQGANSILDDLAKAFGVPAN